MDFSEKLRKLRKEHGLTQQQFGEKTGLATVTVRQYESGKRKPNFEALLKIAQVFGLEITDLYDASNTYIDKRGNLVMTGEAPDRDDGEAELIGNYNRLNGEGKEILLNTSRGLVASGAYKKEKRA